MAARTCLPGSTGYLPQPGAWPAPQDPSRSLREKRKRPASRRPKILPSCNAGRSRDRWNCPTRLAAARAKPTSGNKGQKAACKEGVGRRLGSILERKTKRLKVKVVYVRAPRKSA